MNCNIVYDSETHTRVRESCGEVFDADSPVNCPMEDEGWVAPEVSDADLELLDNLNRDDIY